LGYVERKSAVNCVWAEILIRGLFSYSTKTQNVITMSSTPPYYHAIMHIINRLGLASLMIAVKRKENEESNLEDLREIGWQRWKGILAYVKDGSPVKVEGDPH
jgi:hypothetical protein